MSLLSQYGLSPESIYEDSYDSNSQQDFQNNSCENQYQNFEYTDYNDNQQMCSYTNSQCLYADGYCDQNL